MDRKVFVVFVHFGFSLTSCFHSLPREYTFVNLPMTWAEAQQYCREKYTDLATIERTSDMSRLTRPNTVTSDAWIGLSDDPRSWRENLVNPNKTNSWRWSMTGTTGVTGYLNWTPPWTDTLSNSYSNQHCVWIDGNGRWNDIGCHLERYFVCHTGTITPGQKTYTLVRKSLAWAAAQTYCRTHYTDLAMIENAQENTKMSSVKSTYTVWIGLYRVPWVWSDKSNSSFTNWKSSEPNNYYGDEYCVTENSQHLWIDRSCSNTYPFFCHGRRMKMTMVRMKIQTDADLSDPTVSARILQQLGAALANGGLTDINLKWKIQPRRQEK